MNVLMVRAKIKEENVADARAAIEKVIQALEQAQPAGVRYASCLLSDGDRPCVRQQCSAGRGRCRGR
jgi:thioredoxin-like negative regulator of GroEL